MEKLSWLRSRRSNRRSLNQNGLLLTREAGEILKVERLSLITNSGERVRKEVEEEEEVAQAEEEEGEDTGRANQAHLQAGKMLTIKDNSGPAQLEEGIREVVRNVEDIKETVDNRVV